LFARSEAPETDQRLMKAGIMTIVLLRSSPRFALRRASAD
jgi:hypothetical protein